MTVRDEDPNFMAWLRELQTRVGKLEANEGIKQNNIRLEDWLVTIDDDGCMVADHVKWGTHRVLCGEGECECDDTVTVHSLGAGGSGSLGMTVSPLYVWSSGAVSNTATRFDVESGAPSITTLPGAGNPDGMTYDGTNVLTANFSTGNISVINPTTGAVTATIAVPSSAGMLNLVSLLPAFNVVFATSFNSNSLTEIDGTTYADIGSLSIASYGTGPDGICWDPVSSSSWIACATSNTLVKIHLPGGPITSVSVSGNPKSVCIQGPNVWCGGYSSDTVTKVDITSSAITNYTLPGGFTSTDGIIFDGDYIWTANAEGVCKINPDTGVGTAYPSAPFVGRASGIVRKGDFVWWSNFGASTISRMRVCP